MRKQLSELKKRDLYLNRLIAFQDMEAVKIITGIRRCGKSSLLRLMARHLRDTGVRPEQILELNFDSMAFRGMTAEGLYRYVGKRLPETGRLYLFLDEIQRVDSWQNVVNSFRVDFDCDIYVTGSNGNAQGFSVACHREELRSQSGYRRMHRFCETILSSNESDPRGTVHEKI